MSTSPQTNRLLTAAAEGDPSAASELMPLIQEELRALAARALLKERPDHTLQPTALVNEAYLRLVDQTRVEWKSRAHFLSLAAAMIRRILVDHARSRGAAKRGHGTRKPLDEETPGHLPLDESLLDLDEALGQLHELHERQARVVELRFFGGLSVEETAKVLETSPRTVKGDWRVARAWLHDRLSR